MFKPVSDFFSATAKYGKLLESPEWQAFAKMIRQNHGNACQICKRGNVETHVHHIFYQFNRKPWEYDSEDVVLLCKTCHQEMHERLNHFRKYVFRHLNPQCFRVLNGALMIGLTQHDPIEFCYAIAEMAGSPNSVKRFAAAWIDSKKTI